MKTVNKFRAVDFFLYFVIDDNFPFFHLALLRVSFKTTCTVVWCADHTALCRQHHPHSRLKYYPTTTISTQSILTFFIKFLEKKNFKKISRIFFFKILKKSIQTNCVGGVRVRTTLHLKKLWLCSPHNHTKTQCGLDP